MARGARSLAFAVLALGAAFIGVSVVGDGGCGGPGAAPSRASRDVANAARERDSVVRVVDGDSIRLAAGGEARLIGIDCPERGEPFHPDAARFTDRLLAGRDVVIEFDKERRDRYGRLLAYVFVEPEGGGEARLANELLVEAGLAWCYEVAPNTRYAARLRAAQDAARAARRGVWADALAGVQGEVIASASGRFHRKGCASVASIRLPVAHPSRSAALDAGLTPCRACKP